MSKQYEKLKGLLKELFQLDQPDLDFGLYRIMHAKSKEITQFLDKDLLPQVKAEFARHESGETTELKEKLDKRIKMRQELGDDPDQDAEVQRLRAEITGSGSSPGQLESEVYDHLYGFFRRYYSDGDFLSKRVYKPGVYAIPYEGEEVKLHWANADQYYIKTSEYLRDYAFRLRPDDDEKPMRVHFRLADVAEGEHGNVKAAEGNDRVFILAPEYDPDDPESGAESAADDDSDDAPERHNFIEEEAGEQGEELVVRFEYRKATTKDWPESNRKGQKNPPTQKDLLEIAEVRVAAFFATKKTKPNNENWKDALAAAHTKANGEKADYSRLRANLNRYVARNTFDYFIHKDLGGFLYRELDFYIKNEVMHLDDITDETQTVLRVEQYLSKIRVIRRVAGKIIAFLAQLEDFQKKLWLKKKFVIEVNYCISLNRIPADLYAEIGSNEKQIDEWVLLFGIDAIKKDLHQPGFARPLSSEFLTVFNYLPIDTRHFSRELTDRIVSTMHQYDDASTGLVVNGENFQAVNLIGRQLQKQVSAMYLDPPYNTDAGPITYKNGFRSSSWIALFENRLSVAKSVLADESIICVTIDDFESHNLRFLLDQYFGEDRLLGVVPIKNNPAGRTGTVGNGTGISGGNQDVVDLVGETRNP
jgi:adenine-specific DNA-methyltransferase